MLDRRNFLTTLIATPLALLLPCVSIERTYSIHNGVRYLSDQRFRYLSDGD